MTPDNLFRRIKRLSPLQALRNTINAKIDTKFKEFITPLNLQINACEAKLTEALTQLDFRHLEEIRLLHESLQQEKQVLANQTYSFYQNFFSYIAPRFKTALARILGDEYHQLNQYNTLILLGIIKNYMTAGGIWLLNDEVQAFNSATATIHAPAAHLPPIPPAGAPPPARRLKILIVSGMFPSIEHGGGLRLFDIISQLATDHDIDLFSVFEEKIDQTSLDRLQGRLGVVKLVGQDGMTRENIVGWLNKLGRGSCYYDVIQCEYPHSIPLLIPLRPFANKIGFTFMECLAKSYVIKINNLISTRDFDTVEHFCQLFWTYAVAERAALAYADFSITMTDEDLTMLKRMGDATPHIIPTCISPSEIIDKIAQCSHITPQANTVAFLGYFGHFPNIDSCTWYLEQIHPRIKRSIPDYRFLVVGAGDTSPLKKLTASDPSVEYTGRVDDIIPYILQASVCVLPLISGAGIRGKLNQYSIAGRASVTTTIGNFGLNYQDGHSVLVADSAAAFADAVIALLRDQKLNHTIAENAKAWAEQHFTWGPHLDRLLQIYQA
jgi:glycosyltransferase involved in cell wall biosynthesis